MKGKDDREEIKTMAIPEEGTEYKTMAIPEEGSGDLGIKTMAIPEEGGGRDQKEPPAKQGRARLLQNPFGGR